MCTWRPTGVVYDLLIRECVSELGMYPCLSLCPDDGARGMCLGPVLAAPLCAHNIIIIVIIIIIFDGPLQ